MEILETRWLLSESSLVVGPWLTPSVGGSLTAWPASAPAIGGNSAPVLDSSGAPYLIAPAGSRLLADMQNGILVTDLLARGAGGNPISDADPGAAEGIALTGINKIDGTFGTWEFTLAANPQASDWVNVEAAGAISNSSSLLLPADANARLRFVTTLMPRHNTQASDGSPRTPAQGFLPLETKLDTGVTFRAWDRTTGIAGERADTTANGGSTAFSTATETAGTYFETRLFRSFNAAAQLNTYTLEQEFHSLINNFGYEDRSTSDYSGFTILMSQIPGVTMAPLYRMYFGIAFDSPTPGIQTDMGYRYLTTSLSEVETLESIGPAAHRAERDGFYYRELGVNSGTGITGYLYTTPQHGTSEMVQIYRTDLFSKDTRTGPPGTPARGTVLQEQGDHAYTTKSAFEMTKTGTWRLESGRGFVRELSPYAGVEGVTVLSEWNQFAASQAFPVSVGSTTGTKTVRFDIEALIDRTARNAAVEDLLLVSLVSTNSTSQTLLDRGEPGTTLFTYDGIHADYLPGVVRFDGRTVEIDVSQVQGTTSGRLFFQLLNHDSDDGSQVVIHPITVMSDPEGTLPPEFPSTPNRGTIGGATNLADLTANTTLRVQVDNVRFDETTGRYTAELSLRNEGPSVGRRVAVAFQNLPAGVTLVGVSGQDATGYPYLNLTDAITSGGLVQGATSRRVVIQFDNPDKRRFAISPLVLVGGANQAPVLAAVGPLTVMPGGALVTQLNATDPDGDPVTYSIATSGNFPTGLLSGNGTLTIQPEPNQLGTYTFDVIASDGVLENTRSVTLNVVADPVTTTRVSGQVLQVNGQPLANMLVEIGAMQGLTMLDGSFTLDLGGGPIVSDTIKVRGELFAGPLVYPFIAEKLTLVLEHDIYEGGNNVFARPIFLPTLDVANGKEIDPEKDITVTTSEIPGAAVYVKAGTLMNQQGTPFSTSQCREFSTNGSCVLSITEVPISRTPIALPANLIPDLVVTIQPGEMVFASPAPMTFPNRSGWAPGTLMDLWSINPVTGNFDDVGDMRVSSDGQRIETISGGIRNSSWHFTVPVTQTPVDETNSTECAVACTVPAQTAVEPYSGAQQVDFELAAYESLGTTHAWTLRYDSVRAKPGAVVQFAHTVSTQVGIGDPSRSSPRMFASLDVSHQGITETLPGAPLGGGQAPSNWHFWSATGLASGDTVRGALYMGLDHVPSGFVTYQLNTGFGLLRNDGQLTGTAGPLRGEILQVNSIASPFGSGWGFAGLQEIVVNQQGDGPSPVGSVLLIDGDGSELLFTAAGGNQFTSPRGDFSQLLKLGDGSYRRVLPDRTTYQFSPVGKLASVTDRVGNRTQFQYDAAENLEHVVDPAGLITTLHYVDGKLSKIQLPDGRETIFEIDVDGNLHRIVDPDGAEHLYAYDGDHLLTRETTPRGFEQFSRYDDYGRLSETTATDGTAMHFAPYEVARLYPDALTTNAAAAPPVRRAVDRVTKVTAANGNVVEYTLDRLGAVVGIRDSIGKIGSNTRNSQQLVEDSFGARNQRTSLEYDSVGDVTRIEESLVFGDRNAAQHYPAQNYLSVTPYASDSAAGDFNSDGFPDLAVIGSSSFDISLMFNDGFGAFSPPTRIPTGINGGTRIEVADVNQDGLSDVVAVFNGSGGQLVILLGDGQGSFSAPMVSTASGDVQAIALADFDGDGIVDVAASHNGSLTIHHSDGQGHFQLANTIAIDGAAYSLESGNWNHDQHQDLVVLLRDVNKVRSLLGDGLNGFTVASNESFTGVAFPERGAMTVADLTGDGQVDVAVVASSVKIFAGTNLGAFLASATVNVSGSEKNIVAGDFTGDGAIDLLIGAQNASILAGIGGGLFAQQPSFYVNEVNGDHTVRVADLNNDGLPDLHITNLQSWTVTVVLSTLDAGLNVPIPHPVGGPTPRGVALADFNEDSHLDVAVAIHGANSAAVLLGDGQGNLGTATLFSIRDNARGIVSQGPSVIVSADFNRDGHTDLVTGNGFPGTNDFSYFRGAGNGTLTLVDQYALNGGATAVAAADFNGDSWLDLVFGTTKVGDAVSVFLGSPAGFVAPPLTLPTASSVANLAIADLNADGRPDIVAAVAFNYARTFVNQGNTNFQATDLTDFGNPSFVEVGDLNHDGRLDIFAAHADAQGVFLAKSGGDYEFRSLGSLGVIQDHPVTMTLADLDTDGNLDVLVGDPFTTAIGVVYGDGAGGFPRQAYLPLAGVSIYELAIGDLNSDGRPDLIASHPNTANLTLLASVIPPSASLVREMTYDPVFHQLTSYRDERGYLTTYDLDPATGNRLATHRPDGTTTLRTYTATGQVETETDALGRVTKYEYDNHGWLTRTTLAFGTPDSLAMRYEYDAATTAGRGGFVTAMIVENDGVEQRTTYQYDALNRMVRMVAPDPDGVGPQTSPVTLYEYDAAGNRTSMTDPLGHLTRYEYDARDRLVRTIDSDPDGTGPLLSPVTAYAYSTSGDLIQETDPLGHVTRHRYDLRQRQVESIDPDGGRTTMRYDLDDNLAALTDPVGNTTQWVSDARNRMSSETDPLGAIALYRYDGTNNLVKKIDRNHRVTEYAFDALRRITQEVWVGGGDTIQYSYDLVGNPLAIVDAFSSLAYTYDDRDRVLTVDNAGTPNVPQVMVTYSYDAAGNVMSVSDTAAGGATTSYAYNGLDRLTSLAQAGANVTDKRVDFAYNAIGQTASLDRYSDLGATNLIVQTGFAYDGLNRLTSLTHRKSGPNPDTIAFYQYAYDSASRIARVVDIDGATDYGYDQRDQLTSAAYSSPAIPDESYGYDANGNWVSSHVPETAYQTGPGNRLLSDGTYSYRYDVEGHLVLRTAIGTQQTREFMWDFRDRLQSVIDRDATRAESQRVEFSYDATNRRIAQIVANGTGMQASYFIHDRDEVLLDFVDNDGPLGPNVPVVEHRYLHGAAVDQILAQDNAAGVVEWPLTDLLGSVRDLVDSNPSIINHAQINAFGATVPETSPASTRFGFAGREFDRETGLLFLRARYYDSAVGRFVSVDPLGLPSRDSNAYRYARNNPVLLTDPFGLEAEARGPFDSTEIVADLYSTQGTVEVRRRLGTVWKPAGVGTYFREGDAVRTQPNSRAGVRFADGILVRLNENSLLIFYGANFRAPVNRCGYFYCPEWRPGDAPRPTCSVGVRG